MPSESTVTTLLFAAVAVGDAAYATTVIVAFNDADPFGAGIVAMMTAVIPLAIAIVIACLNCGRPILASSKRLRTSVLLSNALLFVTVAIIAGVLANRQDRKCTTDNGCNLTSAGYYYITQVSDDPLSGVGRQPIMPP
jgi:hypothetical protein